MFIFFGPPYFGPLYTFLSLVGVGFEAWARTSYMVYHHIGIADDGSITGSASPISFYYPEM